VDENRDIPSRIPRSKNNSILQPRIRVRVWLASTLSRKKLRHSSGALVLATFSFYGFLVSVRLRRGSVMARINVVLHRACVAVTAALIFGSAGCATNNNLNLASYFGGNPKPKTIVVSDFELAPGTVSVDHGLAPAYRRKLGKATPDQLKAELATAVNEAVGEAMVTTLNEAGLPAAAGTNEMADSAESMVVVSGRIRKVEDKDRMKRRLSGLAPYRDNVLAEVQMSQQAGTTKKELLAFLGEPDSARKPDAAPATTGSIGGEKLTPAVAAEARRIGNASANKILAYATEQGWISKQSGAPAQSAQN
jgi:Domain of unknown function (DUF4410)